MGSPDGPAIRGIAKPALPPTKVFVRVVFRSGEPVPGVTIFAENLRDSDEQRAATLEPKRDPNGRYTHHLVWEIRADDFASGTEVTVKDAQGKDVQRLKRTLDVKVRKSGFRPPPPPQEPGSQFDFSTLKEAEGRVVRDLIQGINQTVEVVMMDVKLAQLPDPHDGADWTNDLLLDVRARSLFGDISGGAAPDFGPAFTRLAFLHKVGQITLKKEPEFNGNTLVLPKSRKERATLLAPVAGVELFYNGFTKKAIKVIRKDGAPPAYETNAAFFRSKELSNLDLRNAIGLYRLCARLKKEFGVTELHHSGIGSGSGGGANCHNIGTAIDFSGARIPFDRVHRLLAEPFLVYVQEDWADRSVPNKAAMDAAKAANQPTPQTSGFNAEGKRDLAERPAQWPDDTKDTEYRLESLIIRPLGLDATQAQRDEFDRQKAVLDVSRRLFAFVFEFAAQEYSSNAGFKTCGPGCFSDQDVPIPRRMHTEGSIMHADYPKPDDKDKDGKSLKNGRQAHFTHMHFQVGPTDDASGV